MNILISTVFVMSWLYYFFLCLVVPLFPIEATASSSLLSSLFQSNPHEQLNNNFEINNADTDFSYGQEGITFSSFWQSRPSSDQQPELLIRDRDEEETVTEMTDIPMTDEYLAKRLLDLDEHAHGRRDGSLVGLEWATLQGLIDTDSQIRQFLGIPYAEPPIGDLRWKRPLPHPPHPIGEKIFDARAYGPHCIQLGGEVGGFIWDRILGLSVSAGPSEDYCLNLNVHAPSLERLQGFLRLDEPKDAFPVIFFIHGNVDSTGGTAAPLHQPIDLVAREDVIVVTANYRLGLFGFLGGAELKEEDPQASGNYGLYDLRLALKWTRQNIGAFGGDPNRITLLGHSSGSVLACYLMVIIPPGWISNVILLDGGSVNYNKSFGKRNPRHSLKRLAVQAGLMDLEDLRNVSAEALTAAAMKLGWYDNWMPAFDPQEPWDLVRQGIANINVPVLVTSCLDDQIEWPSTLDTNSIVNGPVLEMVEALAVHSQAPVYYYQWNRSLLLSLIVSPIRQRCGTFDATELVLFFGGIPSILVIEGGNRSVQRRLMRFILGGEPGIDDNDEQPAALLVTEKTIESLQSKDSAKMESKSSTFMSCFNGEKDEEELSSFEEFNQENSDEGS